MKKRLLHFKFLCLIILSLSIQVLHAQEAIFTLYYKQGINDVSFVYGNQSDSVYPISVNTSKEDLTTYIHVFEDNMDKNKQNVFSSIANSFISNLADPAHILGLNTSTIKPNQLNFWIKGTLFINGNVITQDFTLGMSQENWWLGTLKGIYIDNQDSAINKGLQLRDQNGNPYCLKEPSSNSDEIFVYNDICANAGSNYATDKGKAKQKAFTLIFGHGISSASFEPQQDNAEDGSGHQLNTDEINIKYQNRSMILTVTAGNNGSVGTANDFNKYLGYTTSIPNDNHMLQLIPANQPEAHKKSVTLNQDFWLQGTLKINGKVVSPDFMLGHNASDDHNWWIGDPNGKRYDSPSNSGITLTSTEDGESYCISDTTANYQAVITQGICSDYSPTTGSVTLPLFSFLFAESITSVQFVPTKFSNKEYSEDGTGAPLESSDFSTMVNSRKHQSDISIKAGSNGSFGTAEDFNHKFGPSRDEEFMHTLEVLPLNDSYSHTPAIATNQNFWISGSLYIESKLVSNNFVIGHNGSPDKNWWVGTLDSSRFDSPTNSGLNVQSADGSKFCLSQYKTNYQLVVGNGTCTANPVKPLYHIPWRIGAASGSLVLTIISAAFIGMTLIAE